LQEDEIMLKLNIYADEYLTTVQETRTVQAMKIPYRTADAVLDMLTDIDFNNVDEYKIINMVLKNKHHVTTIVRATFGLSEDELGRINIMELYDLAKEIVQYVLGQMATLGGDSDPNGQTLAAATR
jgi:hypothetical protein